MSHALADYANPQTMKVKGFLKQWPIIVLIETRSTNNYLNNKVATRLMLQNVLQQIEAKRIAQEMTETRIIRLCFFPATTLHPFIFVSGDKLFLKCYILPNMPWFLMRHSQILGDFHDFPQE
ncbi:hypothetical protein BHE74_00044726 [Ensete ventricosum]|nr:hypothetical protein GW17_00024733 [Ensete ventricosum]RWW49149.1 hypothetical protein BHE74_00044726 [Ensete ventricosum]RZS17948.1 hypothetical protein BHM03_00050155 [Ensete ventricosum]